MCRAHSPSGALGAALSALLLSMSVACADEDATSMLEVLKARAGAAQTFQADVQVTTTAGGDRPRYAQHLRTLAAWYRKNQPELAADNIDQQAKYMTYMPPPQTTFYRYYAQPGGPLRIEEYGGPSEGGREAFDREPILRIYTGDRWLVFTPQSRLGKSTTQHQMMIHTGYQGQIPSFEIARGQAVNASHELRQTLSLSARSQAVAQVDWEEFLRLVSPEATTILRQPLPGGGPPLPLLQVGTAAWKDTGLGLCRARVWFDPAHGYMPVRLESQHLQTTGVPGKYSYHPQEVVEWTRPVRLPGGLYVPQQATHRVYVHSYLPADGVDQKNRPAHSYEMAVNHITFSNIRVNEPLSRSLFTVKPPPSTSVRDEVRGYHYVVGSAGEELRKTAFSMFEEVPPPGKDGSPWPRAWIYAGGALGLVVVAALGYWYVKKRGNVAGRRT